MSTGVHILKCESSDHVTAAPTLPCLPLLMSHPSPFLASAYSPTPLLLPGLLASGPFHLAHSLCSNVTFFIIFKIVTFPIMSYSAVLYNPLPCLPFSWYF